MELERQILVLKIILVLVLIVEHWLSRTHVCKAGSILELIGEWIAKPPKEPKK